MRRLFTKLGSLTAVAVLAFTAAQPAQAEQSGDTAQKRAAAPVHFEFTDVTRSTAVFQLTDAAKIQEARDILSGKEKERVHVMGRLDHRAAPYNPRWSYHLRPESISFFDQAIEVCDATIPYVEDYLDEAGGAFLPGNYWCPWTSRLVRELPAQ
ncbi:calmodulin-binding protein [Streptomyces sp. NPDC059943]|uniref:BP74-related protein n=1 Tax=Streptomyces sp. NPDC059943 TaxID=3347010 RepID=UPI00364E2F44